MTVIIEMGWLLLFSSSAITTRYVTKMKTTTITTFRRHMSSEPPNIGTVRVIRLYTSAWHRWCPRQKFVDIHQQHLVVVTLIEHIPLLLYVCFFMISLGCNTALQSIHIWLIRSALTHQDVRSQHTVYGEYICTHPKKKKVVWMAHMYDTHWNIFCKLSHIDYR
jgi:hypothetical protein